MQLLSQNETGAKCLGNWELNVILLPLEFSRKSGSPWSWYASPLILQTLILSARWAEWIRLLNLEKLAQHTFLQQISCSVCRYLPNSGLSEYNFVLRCYATDLQLVWLMAGSSKMLFFQNIVFRVTCGGAKGGACCSTKMFKIIKNCRSMGDGWLLKFLYLCGLEKAGDGVRTRDPQLGKLMLYQLSYSRSEWHLYSNHYSLTGAAVKRLLKQ